MDRLKGHFISRMHNREAYNVLNDIKGSEQHCLSVIVLAYPLNVRLEDLDYLFTVLIINEKRSLK